MDLASLFNFKKTHVALSNLEKLLICKKCNQYCKNPRRHSDCGNLLCACFAAESGSCPFCGGIFSQSNTSPDWQVNSIIEATKKIKELISKKSMNEEKDEGSTEHSLSESKKESSPSEKDLQKNVKVNKPVRISSEKVLKEQHSKPSIEKHETNEKKNVHTSKNSHNVSSSSNNHNKINNCVAGLSKDQMKNNSVIKSIMKRNAKGETKLHSACVKGDKKKVEEFLAAGADPCTKDNAGWTPLHEAVSKGNIDLVKLLLEAGAMVNVPGGYNNTPLHDAVLGNYVEIARLLINFGADPDLKNIEGYTPRSIAQNEEMRSLLESHKSLKPVCPKERINLFQKDIVLYGINLLNQDQDNINVFTRKFKIRQCASLHSDVTHIVVATKKGCCTPNLDILCGILKGKWIVSSEWLTSCLNSSEIVDASAFEVIGTNSFPDSKAPMKSRLNAENMQPSLFNGIHFYFSGIDKIMYNESKLTKTQLAMLVTCGDGVVLTREPNPEAIPNHECTFPYHGRTETFEKCSHVIVYQQGRNEPLLKYNMNHVKSLPISWFLDSIETFQLMKP